MFLTSPIFSWKMKTLLSFDVRDSCIFPFFIQSRISVDNNSLAL
jgi:hypothetical protein